MNDIAVCVSSEDRCGLAITGPVGDRILRLDGDLAAARMRGKAHTVLVEQLGQYLDRFQRGPFCSGCGQALVSITRPSEKADVQNRANEMLQVGYRLQAMGLLAF